MIRGWAKRRSDERLRAGTQAGGSEVGDRIAAGDPAARAGAGRRRVTRPTVVLLAVGCLGVVAGAFGLSASQAIPAAAATIQPRGAAASATYASDSATTLKLTVPTGTQSGDVLVASLGIGKSGASAEPTLTAPAGWNLVSRTNYGTSDSIAVYTHTFAAGETSYSWTTNVTVGGTLFVAAFGNVNTATPVDVFGGAATTTAGTSFSAPSVTTTKAGDEILASFFGYVGGGTGNSWTAPSGMTQIGNANNGGSRSGALDDLLQATAGASGQKTATSSVKESYGIGALTALVAKQTQAISFTSSAPTGASVGGASYAASATGGGSGNPVTVTVDPSSSGVCTISAGVVSFTGLGTCTLDANQAGNAAYTAAPQVQQSFAVGGGTTAQTIGFTSSAPSAASVGGATYTPVATATSTLPVALTVDPSASAVCAISGGVVSFSGAGTCVIDANQAGNTTYSPAAQVQQSFTVGPGATATPLAPPAFTLTPGAGALTINSFAAVVHATSYSYQLCDAAGANCTTAQTVTTAGTTITGLVGGTTYTVELTAVGDGVVYANSTPTSMTGSPAAVTLASPTFTLTAGSGTLAINAFTAVAHASSYSYQLCDAAGVNCTTAQTVTSAGTTITGLVGGTTYTVELTAVGDGVAYTNSVPAAVTGTPTAVASGPAPLIVDTDIFTDAGDAGSLAEAYALQLKGEAKVIATVINTRTSRPSVATNQWKCAAAIQQYYGSPTTMLGSDTPLNGTQVNSPDIIGPCAALAAPTTPTPDTAVNVYRKALASQPDGSVVIASIGYFENLSALLNSPADAISPLNGHDLVARKVKELVAMAGCYTSCTSENNIVGNPAAAANVAANWPTKIVWSGYEVGDQVHTGQTISSVQPISSPVRAAYVAFVGLNNWIYSFDLTAVYHAIRPSDANLTEVGPGTNSVNTSTGANTFTKGAGNQYYLALGSVTALDSSIETLLDVLPPGPPPNDTFDSNTLSPTLWSTATTGSSVAAVNHELEISHPGGSWTTGTLQSAQTYDITGKATQIQVKRAANNGLSAAPATGGQTSIVISADATHSASFFIAGGGIAADVKIGTVTTNITPTWVRYSATNMQWLRLRESGGTLYWEYAAGTTAPGPWTVLAHAVDPFPMTAVKLQIIAGSDVATTDTAAFDNITTG